MRKELFIPLIAALCAGSAVARQVRVIESTVEIPNFGSRVSLREESPQKVLFLGADLESQYKLRVANSVCSKLNDQSQLILGVYPLADHLLSQAARNSQINMDYGGRPQNLKSLKDWNLQIKINPESETADRHVTGEKLRDDIRKFYFDVKGSLVGRDLDIPKEGILATGVPNYFLCDLLKGRASILALADFEFEDPNPIRTQLITPDQMLKAYGYLAGRLGHEQKVQVGEVGYWVAHFLQEQGVDIERLSVHQVGYLPRAFIGEDGKLRHLKAQDLAQMSTQMFELKTRLIKQQIKTNNVVKSLKEEI
jgi:hypothetical protein